MHFLSFLNKRPNLYSIFHILLSSLIALLVMFFLFPGLFRQHQFSFIRFTDQEIDSYGVFTIISNFFHGGIQLWNNYDQMPLAYFYLNGGMTSFSNLFTALVYIILSPFLRFPARDFQTIYSVAYFYGAILIRSAGYYLLLSRFTKNKIVLLFSSVFGSTIMSPQSFMGLNSSNIFSFFPLIMHFILRIFETRKFKYILLFFLIMIVCVANYPLMGLGYFYLGVHLMLFSTIVWFLLINRKRLVHISSFLKIRVIKKICWQSLLVVVLSFFILFPFIIMLKENYKDYDFAGDTSRFANLNIFDISNYFKRETYTANQGDIFNRTLNYEDNQWYSNWLFLGITSTVLAVYGLVLGRDNKKFIFAGTALLFWLVNSPRNLNSLFSPLSFGHWLVALTDPFNFTLRTFHMTGALMMPFVLLPLVMLGMNSIFEAENISSRKIFFKLLLAELISFFIFLSVYPNVSLKVKSYLIFGFIVVSGIFVTLVLRRRLKIFLPVIISFSLALLLFIDSLGMRTYYQIWLEGVKIVPQVLPNSPFPQFIDYQNPLILPFRKYYSVDNREWSGWGNTVDNYNSGGLFFHRTNFYNFFTPASIYYPRHISYSRIAWDKDLQEYLNSDNRLIYQADIAASEQSGLLRRLREKNKDRSVIQVEGYSQAKASFSDEEIDNLPFNSQPSLQFKKIILDLNLVKPAKDGDLVFYSVKLPPSFPNYMASDIFSNDRLLINVSIDNRDFSPSQGNLIHPFAFDVQNMETGYLVVSLPLNYRWQRPLATLTYPTNPGYGIESLWKYQPDNLGFYYQTDKDGWLVFNYPFVKRWQIEVDGKREKLYKVNYSFIGLPVTQGNHSILLQYWPGTPLRQAIALSIFLIIISPIIIVISEIKTINKTNI